MLSGNNGILDLEIEEFEKKVQNNDIKISVIGLGRIGLPTSVVIARANFSVIGVDINHEIVEFVNNGKLRINDEPGLEDALKKVIENKKFIATTKINESIKNSDIIIVCLPTPLENKSKKTDYQFLLKGCSEIAKFMKKNSLVIIESTVGPGIVENEVIPVLEKESHLVAGKDFGVASCPERANPSTILTDFNKIPRVVGGINDKSIKFASKLYQFVFKIKVISVKNCKTANAVKVVENVFRDVNVAFINEIAIFCDRMGIDVNELIEGCKTKYNFIPHFPGPGVGGPCLPVNPYQLLDAPESKDILQIVRTARIINSEMPKYPKMTNLAACLQTGGIWFSNGKFGTTWKLFQAVVKPRATLRGRCHISLDSEDKDKLSKQKEDDSDSENEDSVAVEDSDQEDEKAEENEEDKVATPPASPTPTPSAPKKKKKVVRRKKSAN